MKNIARFAAVGMAAVATSATLPAAEVTLTVPAHQTNTVAECLAAEGKSFSTGDILVKKGPGSITTTTPYTNVLGGIQIDEGVFRALSTLGTSELGPNSASIPLTVKSGATAFLQLGSPDPHALNFHIYIAGDGNGEYSPSGALVFNTGHYRPFAGVRLHLTDDATISSILVPNGPAAYSGIFSNGHIYLGGHTLTFRGVSPDFAIRYRLDGTVNDDGTVIVDNIGFASSGVSGNASYKGGTGNRTMKLVNGGRFLPGHQTLVDCFATYDCEYGTMIGCDRASSTSIPLTFVNITGAPEIFSNVTKLTITGIFKVRLADVAAGHRLCASSGSSYPLEFANGSAFDIDTVIGLAADTDYVVATAPGGITGLPTPIGRAAGIGITLRLADNNTSLVAHVPASSTPDGAVNVQEWGVLPGADNREGNAARFAAGLAGTNNVTVFFPAGTYHFDDALSVAGRENIVLLGTKDMSEIVAPASAAAVIEASNSDGLAVSNLILSAESGFTGVALSATGCANLVVEGNTYSGIPGGPTQVPVTLSGCTDAFVGINTVSDGTIYTALASAENNTTLLPGSEPQDDVIVLTVPVGVSEEFYEAFARTGRASFPQGAKLVKRGAGTLASTNTLRTLMSCFEIEAGVLEMRKEHDGGIRNTSVTNRIAPGATLFLNIDNVSVDAFLLYGQWLAFSGTGAPGFGGAIVVRKSSYQCVQNIRMILEDDATIAGRGNFYPNGVLTQVKLDLHGHTLTMLGAGAALNNYRIRESASVFSTGRLVVDNATLSVTSAKGSYSCQRGVEPLVLVLTNGAALKVDNGEYGDAFFKNMVGTLVAEPGCTFSSDVPDTPIAPNVPNLEGALAVDGTVTLSVTNTFTVRAADLVAGHHLAATNTLSFAGARLVLAGGDADAAVLAASGMTQFVLATSEESISALPDSHALTRYGLEASLSADRKTCILGPLRGTIIVIQ